MTASKKEVVSEGVRRLICKFQNGDEKKTTWEVGPIHRPLASVSSTVKLGHAIWFDSEENGGSGIYDYRSGTTSKIYERNGVYVLPAWIRPPGFTRQEANP